LKKKAMTLSDDLRDLIIQDFFDIFQARYGKEWRSKLTTNLRPSPIYQIAEQRGVSVTDVKKVRSQILAVAHFINVFTDPFISQTPNLEYSTQ
jgi:hypothetical protein